MSIATRTADIFESYVATTEAHTYEERDPYMSPPTAAIAAQEKAPDPDPDANHAAERLRLTTAAVRVGFTWFGTRKALSTEQHRRITEDFDAQTGSITAGKKLLNTKHPAYRAVTAIKTRILNDWKDSSLPFPEQGIRLIRQDDVRTFNDRMESYRVSLAQAVEELDRHFNEMLQEARIRLGRLYQPDDYPSTMVGLFAVIWEFPNVEPPDYLMQLKPALYEAERARVAGQFDEAVRLAEEAFTRQFADAIAHLCERLTRGEDGNPKVFRDSAIGNLHDFFDRFATLGMRSNAQLDALVDQARQAVRGASPNRLRNSTNFREDVARQLADVEHTLATMMVDRPRRNIQRPTRPGGDQS